MLTQEEDVEIHALRKRGRSMSEIARHTGRDRKTVRAYLGGVRQPGVRAPVESDSFDRIEPYVAQRLADDHGVWATTLFDEVKDLGYDRSYPTFTRKIRQRGLRPHCEACTGVKGRATVIIEHPSGEEVQWDWDELGTCPWEPTAEVSLLVVPCRIHPRPGDGSRIQRISRISLRVSMRSCAASVAHQGCGGWIGWRP